MSVNRTNEIIVVQQLPVIAERLQTIKAEITKRTDAAMSLACTEDTVKAVKKVRADLNTEFKGWEDKRKEVKKAIMSPYEQFESIYKDCITDVFKKADTDLKNKINSVEKDLKDQKANAVIDYFMEYRDSKGRDLAEFVTFLDTNINVTLSASLKSLKEQAKAFIDRVCDDLALIETQEHRDEILYEYKQSLNVSAAITTVVNRYKAIEEAKAKEEAQRERAEAAKQAAEKVEALAPPKEEAPEPILTVNFSVKGTRTQLKALKEFLERNKYEYR